MLQETSNGITGIKDQSILSFVVAYCIINIKNNLGTSLVGHLSYRAKVP